MVVKCVEKIVDEFFRLFNVVFLFSMYILGLGLSLVEL